MKTQPPPPTAWRKLPAKERLRMAQILRQTIAEIEVSVCPCGRRLAKACPATCPLRPLRLPGPSLN
jgi:hypothetical protein